MAGQSSPACCCLSVVFFLWIICLKKSGSNTVTGVTLVPTQERGVLIHFGRSIFIYFFLGPPTFSLDLQCKRRLAESEAARGLADPNRISLISTGQYSHRYCTHPMTHPMTHPSAVSRPSSPPLSTERDFIITDNRPTTLTSLASRIHIVHLSGNINTVDRRDSHL